METIKNTVAHALGKDKGVEGTTTNTAGHHSETTGHPVGHHSDTTGNPVGHHSETGGTANTAPYDPGNATEHTSTLGSTVHDQTTTGSSQTGSHGFSGTPDTTTTGGSTGLGRHANEYTTGGNDGLGRNATTAGGTTALGRDATSNTTGGNTGFGGDTTGSAIGGSTAFGRDTANTTGGNTHLGRDATTTGGSSHLGRDTTTTTGGDTAFRSDATGATSASNTTGHSSGLESGVDSTHRTEPHTGTSDTSRGRDTTTDDSSHKHHDPHEIQSPSQGPDPALVGDAKEHVKLTGQGAPGSHSAVFGLTPDGKRYDDSSSKTTAARPAHSEETTLGKKSVSGASGADSGRDAVSGGRGGVSDQMDAPDQAKKGLERTDPAPIQDSGSGGKPGAGLTGLKQGGGEV